MIIKTSTTTPMAQSLLASILANHGAPIQMVPLQGAPNLSIPIWAPPASPPPAK